ncbi:MAG: signal recognition particle protein [Clostridia bacterium]|nr:signal recognition particle protein [Clostridia bacterium]
MVFEGLAEKLQSAFAKLRKKGKVTEKDVKVAMKEVKLALLEADVNFLVVKKFIKKVTDRAVGQEVMTSLTPGQQIIKIVNEELTELMGGKASDIQFSPNPPTIIMMVGLQGAGKTTTAGKLGLYLNKKGKTPLLVACDVYRPAAVKQLEIVGQKVGVPVFKIEGSKDPLAISKSAVEHAKQNNNDVVIIDTAGRLHIDETMMDELQDIKQGVNVDEILLVVDSMTGQDAVNVAQSFNQKLEITGVVLTKLDGDTRGGAALSIRSVADCAIKFAGVGEKLEDFELFHPDRMASRILGMGDVLSLIEKAQSELDEKKALELQKKFRQQQFTFEDFLEQLHQMKNMGPLDSILGMLPGVNTKKLKGLDFDERQLVRIEAIINSMTKDERLNPKLINGSRRRRIASGSGTKIQDVNKLIKQFEQTKKMMKQFDNMDKAVRKGKINFPFF